MSDRPIGIFDSGIGGMSVLKELRRLLPGEDFIYLGDTARLPYGTKSLQTIAKYSEQVCHKLLEYDVKAIVIACHSASSSFLNFPFELSVPIFNVVTPSCEQAALYGSPMGVIGTRATTEGGVYQKELSRLGIDMKIYSQACPLLVPLVEEAWEDDPLTNLIVYRYLAPLEKLGLKSLVLGCTHFPMLSSSIDRVFQKQVPLIEPGLALAKTLKLKQGDNFQLSKRIDSGQLRILTTDISPLFQDLSHRIMSGIEIPEPELINLN